MKRPTATSSAPGASPPKFPKVHEYAEDIYREDTIHRDNSPFLAELAKHKAAIFLRPMQLGKTSLFTLAELVFSIRETAPTNLEVQLPPEQKNSFFVLRIDFGNVSAATNFDWKFRAADFDKAARRKVQVAVERFISDHGVRPLENSTDLSAGDLLDELVTRIRTKDSRKPKLLVLVDEYDKPVREVLLNLIATDHGDEENLRLAVKEAYRHYVSFFDTCKTTRADADLKVWVTGITPIGLSLISGFKPVDLTFKPSMANAVGLLRDNVLRMIDAVHQYNPFASVEEMGQLAKAIEKHFNSLRYEGGGGLYHTGMVNELMADVLTEADTRAAWLKDLDKSPPGIRPEDPPTSAITVIRLAPNLRQIVDRLAGGHEVTGFAFNSRMTLSHLVKKDVDTGDYLTLLVYLGMVSWERTDGLGDTFRSTSFIYREDHLKELLKVLRVSVEKLMELTATDAIYAQGVGLLYQFASALSENRMDRLIAWAEAENDNNIMELQLQGFLVQELHATLKEHASTTQEKRPPGQSKRKDITIAGDHSVIVLQLKKLNGPDPPTQDELDVAHSQLKGYVLAHRTSEKLKKTPRVVAGFVLVMYANGRKYQVQPLKGD